MATIDDNTALLLYRVGPVLCCAPCLAISAIIEPQTLTRPPGSSSGRPGIFKYANTIVSSLDLRYKFGVEEADWANPGRTIITHLDKGHIGFYVDEIRDVISMPTSGWGPLPALLPRGIFTRTLLFKEHIYLYADFNDLQRIPDNGYLRQYIQQLFEATQHTPQTQTEHAVLTDASIGTLTPPTDATQPKHTVHSDAATPVQRTLSVSAAAPMTHTDPRRYAAASEDKATHISPPTPKQYSVSPRTPALRTATAASFSARNQSAPSVHTNNKVTALSSTPSPTPSTTAAQRSPVALVASNKPAPPITSNQSTSTRAATPSQHSARENARHSDTGNLFGITLLLLLLFALTGGGLWYVLRESHQQVVIPDVTPVAAPITQTPSAPVPAIKSTKAADIQTENKSPTTSATQSEQVRHATSQPAPSNVPVTTTEPAVPQPANKQTTVPDIQSATTNAAKPSASANDYHARIEQDPQGLTIILDAPANDPVFTQAPLAASNDTTASTAVAANNSEMQNAPPVHPQAPERASTAKTESATTPSAAPMSVEIIHIVVKGDTLWAIAKRYVNNPFRYPELARLSKIKNPDLIYPGNRVRIIKRRHQP